ncbi:uncharacterized protein LOC143878501 [Tasmannia lanceolata]|uniref:uncharacterized protein LOC143878501 n=1 Tax=Tasmannia lanceolata TaxID=3420 RepID=UPI0040646941
MVGRDRGRDSSRGGRTTGSDLSGGRGYSSRPHPYCTHCRREGHYDETCYVLHLERRLQQPSHAGRAAHLSTLDDSDPRASSSGSIPSVPSFTQTDYDELQCLRLATRSPSAGFAQPGSTPASLLSSSSSWIIDSGASNHVTGSCDWEDVRWMGCIVWMVFPPVPFYTALLTLTSGTATLVIHALSAYDAIL